MEAPEHGWYGQTLSCLLPVTRQDSFSWYQLLLLVPSLDQVQ